MLFLFTYSAAPEVVLPGVQSDTVVMRTKPVADMET